MGINRNSWFAFFLLLGAMVYFVLIAFLVIGNVTVVTSKDFIAALKRSDIHQSLFTTVSSCSISTLIAMFLGVPCAYVLSRYKFHGKKLLESIIDIPLVLPPIVVGLCLLIVFNRLDIFGSSLDDRLEQAFGVQVTFHFAAIVIAQFMVTTALVVQLLRPTFDKLSPRAEKMACLFGASRFQAFRHVLLSESRFGLLAAATLAWAKAFGEFGPILVFAGAIRGRTEVMATSVFLELNTGNIGAAMSVALLMILVSLLVVWAVRMLAGKEKGDA